MPPKVAVVVPCYNEARRLRTDAFLRFSFENPDVEFIFVNDGSSDDTEAVLSKLASDSVGHMRQMKLSANRGKAEAVRQGMLHAIESGGEYCGYWDADLATPLSEIDTLVGVLMRFPQAEIVLGSRVKLLGYRIRRRATRHYLGRGFATAISIALNLPVYDTQCGAKMFRVSARVKDLFVRPFLARWIFDVEILARYLSGMSRAERDRVEEFIRESPLAAWEDVAGSRLRLRDYVVAGRDFARILRAYPEVR